MRNSCAAEHTDHGEHRRNARTIVGDSRAIQAAALLPDVQRRRRRKDRINMRAESNETAPIAGTNAEHVANLVHLHFGEPEFAKAVGQPGAARRLSEWRCGNPRRLHLPQPKLRSPRAEPVASAPPFPPPAQPPHPSLPRASPTTRS